MHENEFLGILLLGLLCSAYGLREIIRSLHANNAHNDWMVGLLK